MREQYGNLWQMQADARCITTNGTVKKNGAVVMGRGVALQARDEYPGIDLRVGKVVRRGPPGMLQVDVVWDDPVIICFPVKYNWWEHASLPLIRESAQRLVELADMHREWGTILLPRPGCGNGQLRWEQVRPEIEGLLDDRFVIVDRHP